MAGMGYAWLAGKLLGRPRRQRPFNLSPLHFLMIQLPYLFLRHTGSKIKYYRTTHSSGGTAGGLGSEEIEKELSYPLDLLTKKHEVHKKDRP